MRTRLLVGTLGVLGVACGSASAAFWATTSNEGSSFSTAAVASQPVIGSVRVTDDPGCGAASPASTIRQAGDVYVCVSDVTDPAGITSVSADLSPLGAGSSVALSTSGGPFGGYVWRSARVSAGVPLQTGTTGAFDVSATNGDGNRSVLAGQPFNVRSYAGLLVGEFGEPADATAQVYYRLSTTGVRDANLGSYGSLYARIYGSPQRGVAGALVGTGDGAMRFSAASLDHLRFGRPTTIAADYTVEAWVRGSATSGAGPGNVWSDSAGLVDAGAAGTNDFGVSVSADGRVLAGCGDPNANLESDPALLGDGGWHHVVFTRRKATGDIRLFIDGGLMDASASCGTADHTGSTNIYVGRSHESDLYLSADVDEVALYSRALPASEILDHYELGRGLG